MLTGSEALVLLAFKSGDVKSYATPKLEPLLTETQGRSLIGTLLTKENKGQEASTTNKEPTPLPDFQWDDEDAEAAEYVEDDQTREKEFKTRFTQVLNKVFSLPSPGFCWLRNQCKILSVTANPESGAEVLLLVATPSGKILSYTTPKLQPFTNTGPGQKLITALMNADDDNKGAQ